MWCPTNDFSKGKTINGKCDGCGHYLCKECVNFNHIRLLKELRNAKNNEVQK